MVAADSIPPSSPTPESPDNHFDSASSIPSLRPPVPPSLSPRDSALLQSLLTLRLDFSALALKENLPAEDLIALAESPAIAPRLQSLRRLANLSLDIRHTQARRAAVDILESIALTAEDPIEKRRAAAALLRRPDAPTRSAGPRSPSPYPPISQSHHHSPARRAPSPSLTPTPSHPPPDPDLPPEAIASKVTDALLFAGVPDQALANLFPFLAPGAHVCGRAAPPTIPEFIASHCETPAAAIPHFRKTRDIQINHRCSDPSGEIFLLEVTSADTRHRLYLTVTKLLGRWLISRITTDPPAQPPPPGATPPDSPSPDPVARSPSAAVA